VRQAIDQAYKRGYLGKNIGGKAGFNFDLYIHMGAGSYECGEESALMSSLMGERGQPRLKPPHAPLPIIAGVWNSPTLINNVETYTCVPHIIANGGAWYAAMGTESSKGTKIISVSGHVAKPGNYEFEFGTPLTEMIETAGGVTGGKLKAVIPGGSSVPLIPAEIIDQCKLDYDAHQVIQYPGRSARLPVVGSGGFMVFNERTDIVVLMKRTAEFYAHESCGKCTPCREGTRWLYKILSRITSGGGMPGDIDLLVDICDQIDGRSYCALGDAAAWPIMGSIKHYRHEYEHWIAYKQSPIGKNCLPPVPEVINPLLQLTLTSA
jgi:NADH-quinone oxidoreductase subunit F